jgi:hypothetical protein
LKGKMALNWPAPVISTNTLEGCILKLSP